MEYNHAAIGNIFFGQCLKWYHRYFLKCYLKVSVTVSFSEILISIPSIEFCFSGYMTMMPPFPPWVDVWMPFPLKIKSWVHHLLTKRKHMLLLNRWKYNINKIDSHSAVNTEHKPTLFLNLPRRFIVLPEYESRPETTWPLSTKGTY